jgi:hypothetical protein
MASEGLRELWRERLDSFTRSGQSVRAWCAEQEIPEHQFHYWRRRLTEESPTSPGAGWVAMAVVPASVPGGVAIRMGRALVEVQPGFDAGLLRAVVRALEPMLGAESAPC